MTKINDFVLYKVFEYMIDWKYQNTNLNKLKPFFIRYLLDKIKTMVETETPF